MPSCHLASLDTRICSEFPVPTFGNFRCSCEALKSDTRYQRYHSHFIPQSVRLFSSRLCGRRGCLLRVQHRGMLDVRLTAGLSRILTREDDPKNQFRNRRRVIQHVGRLHRQRQQPRRPTASYRVHAPNLSPLSSLMEDTPNPKCQSSLAQCRRPAAAPHTVQNRRNIRHPWPRPLVKQHHHPR